MTKFPNPPMYPSQVQLLEQNLTIKMKNNSWISRLRQSKSLIEIALSICLSVRLQNEMDTKFKTTYSAYTMGPSLIVRPLSFLLF